MKLAAHPLVVAVALGLIAPGALATLDSDTAPTAPCTDCTDAERAALQMSHLSPSVDNADALASVELHAVMTEALSLLA